MWAFYNKIAEEASSSNAAATLSVIKALNGIGISNSSIETQGYSLSVNCANCNSSCIPQIIGYSVTNSLQVNFTSASPSASPSQQAESGEKDFKQRQQVSSALSAYTNSPDCW